MLLIVNVIIEVCRSFKINESAVFEGVHEDFVNT